MAGYTRIFDKSAGDRIDAEDFNDEYDSLADAFNSTTGHSHDGTSGNGALISKIADPNEYTTVAVDNVLKSIDFSVEFGGAKETQLHLRDGLLVPALNDDFVLGSPSNKFSQLHVSDLHSDTLALTVGPEITAILDEDDMASDSENALATQQSIKAFVENAIDNSVGIFSKAVTVRRETDQSLTGSYADYLSTSISVAAGSKLHVFATVTASMENAIGSVNAHLFLNGSELNPLTEERIVVSALSPPASPWVRTTTICDSTLALSAGNYIVSLRLREQGPDGTALSAVLIIFEEAA